MLFPFHDAQALSRIELASFAPVFAPAETGGNDCPSIINNN